MSKQTKTNHTYASDLHVQSMRIVPNDDRSQREQAPLPALNGQPIPDQAPERDTLDRLIRKIKKI